MPEAIETKKAVRALKKLCKEHGIKMDVVSAGRGSHTALIFNDPDSNQTIKVVVGGHGEISPGVQRNAVQYVEEARKWVGVAKLAATVAKILKDVFFG